MNRRRFAGAIWVGLLGGLLVACSDPPRVYRIGYLHPTNDRDVAYTAFSRALKEAGYVVGRNTVVEERFADGDVARLPALAADLVAKRVEVIVAVAPPAIRAARSVTTTVPIVMAFSGDDPVKAGFAATLARPGGNITGLTTMALDMAPTWIETLTDLAPDAKIIAVLRSPRRPDHTAQIDAMRATAQARGVRLLVVEVDGVDRYADAFAEIERQGGQAIVVLSGPEFTHNRVRLVELISSHRLPSIYQFADFVEVGGLVSYGPDIADLSARAVRYVDKIVQGANPAELPIEQPQKLSLVLNRGTATQLGIAIPPWLALEATRIVQ